MLNASPAINLGHRLLSTYIVSAKDYAYKGSQQRYCLQELHSQIGPLKYQYPQQIRVQNMTLVDIDVITSEDMNIMLILSHSSTAFLLQTL